MSEYYVCPSNTTETTLQNGTVQNPWKMNAIPWVSVSPGDEIRLLPKFGANGFSELLTIGKSGTDENLINFVTAPGESDRAVIDGGGVRDNCIFCQVYNYIGISNIDAKNSVGSGLDFYSVGNEALLRNITIANMAITGIGNNGIALTGSDFTIKNLTISNIEIDGIYARGKNLSVEDCYIYDVAQSTDTPGDCIQISTLVSGYSVKNNRLYNMSNMAKQCFIAQYGDGSSGGLFEGNTCRISTDLAISHYAIQTRNKGAIIRGNVFEGGNYTAVALFGTYVGNTFRGATSVGVRVSVDSGTEDTGDVKIYHNVIDTCVTGIFHDSATLLDIKNNIVVNNTNTGIKVNTPGIASTTNDYNCLYGNTADYFGVTAGANDIVSNPGISSTGKLLPTSPCIDAGTYIPGVNMEGQTDPWGRKLHSIPNVGADQGTGAPKSGSRQFFQSGNSGCFFS